MGARSVATRRRVCIAVVVEAREADDVLKMLARRNLEHGASASELPESAVTDDARWVGKRAKDLEAELPELPLRARPSLSLVALVVAVGALALASTTSISTRYSSGPTSRATSDAAATPTLPPREDPVADAGSTATTVVPSVVTAAETVIPAVPWTRPHHTEVRSVPLPSLKPVTGPTSSVMPDGHVPKPAPATSVTGRDDFLKEL